MKSSSNIIHPGNSLKITDKAGFSHKIYVNRFADMRNTEAIYHPIEKEHTKQLVVTIESELENNSPFPSPYAACVTDKWVVHRDHSIFEFVYNSDNESILCNVTPV